VNNGGKRGSEYGLRKAAVLLKAGKTDAAGSAFDAVIAANPADANLYVKAAEAMLSGKQGKKAAEFAERGLAVAREAGNRDLAGACEELLAAGKKYS
jgi:predicted Zn-dependent protease